MRNMEYKTFPKSMGVSRCYIFCVYLDRNNAVTTFSCYHIADATEVLH